MTDKDPAVNSVTAHPHTNWESLIAAKNPDQSKLFEKGAIFSDIQTLHELLKAQYGPEHILLRIKKSEVVLNSELNDGSTPEVIPPSSLVQCSRYYPANRYPTNWLFYCKCSGSSTVSEPSEDPLVGLDGSAKVSSGDDILATDPLVPAVGTTDPSPSSLQPHKVTVRELRKKITAERKTAFMKCGCMFRVYVAKVDRKDPTNAAVTVSSSNLHHTGHAVDTGRRLDGVGVEAASFTSSSSSLTNVAAGAKKRSASVSSPNASTEAAKKRSFPVVPSVSPTATDAFPMVATVGQWILDNSDIFGADAVEKILWLGLAEMQRALVMNRPMAPLQLSSTATATTGDSAVTCTDTSSAGEGEQQNQDLNQVEEDKTAA